MGDVGTALAFMLTLVTGLVVTLYVLAYAMHCLLVVVRDTAGGQDEVTWPTEPFQDWVGGAMHLVVVVVALFAPAGILARSLGRTWLQDDPTLRFVILSLPSLWLLFPVALFSSLSGSSRWFVFRPVIVWNLLRVAPFTAAFYVASALLAAAVGALGYAAFGSKYALVLFPVAAAGAAAALLMYARLLGRLAWRMGRLKIGRRKGAKPAGLKVGGVQAQDPWAAPEEPPAEAPLPEEETTPFGRKRRRVKGYGLAPQAPAKPPEAPPPEPKPQPVKGDRPQRAELRPGSPFLGVVAFPWYERSRMAWLLLALGFLALGTVASILLSLYAKLAGQA